MSTMYLGHKTWFQEYEEASYIAATSRKPQEMSTDHLAAFFWPQSENNASPLSSAVFLSQFTCLGKPPQPFPGVYFFVILNSVKLS